MSSSIGKPNFIVAHYDWLALGIALLMLLGSGAVLVSAFGSDPEEVAAETESRLEAKKPEATGVKSENLDIYDRVTSLIRKPPALNAVAEKAANFLTSELRVKCMHCNAPMPGDAKNCGECGKAPPEKQQIVYDSDNDGLTDDWEVRYGLNPKDPNDAHLDLDGDGFTNFEEYEAKTDPTDPKSHPDYFDSLKLVLPLKETKLPFVFEKVMKLPSGFRFYFKDPKARNDYGQRGKQYTPLAGEDIGTTGFTVKAYEQRSKKQKLAAAKGEKAMERTIDVSVAKIVRKSDNREFELVVGDKNHIAVDVQANLVYNRGGTKEFSVVAGDTVDLNGDKYKVKEVKPVGKGGKVTLEHDISGKLRTLDALE